MTDEILAKAYNDGVVIYYEDKDVIDGIFDEKINLVRDDGTIFNLMNKDKKLVDDLWQAIDPDDPQGRPYKLTSKQNELHEIWSANFGGITAFAYTGTETEIDAILRETRGAYFRPTVKIRFNDNFHNLLSKPTPSTRCQCCCPYVLANP